MSGSSFKRFTVCNDDCPEKDAFPGFISKGYYPTTPKKPNNALHVDVIEFFHLMYMKGPSSKQVYVQALRSFCLARHNLKDIVEDSDITSEPSHMVCSIHF
jgi:hypothetical protein